MIKSVNDDPLDDNDESDKNYKNPIETTMFYDAMFFLIGILVCVAIGFMIGYQCGIDHAIDVLHI